MALGVCSAKHSVWGTFNVYMPFFLKTRGFENVHTYFHFTGEESRISSTPVLTVALMALQEVIVGWMNQVTSSGRERGKMYICNLKVPWFVAEPIRLSDWISAGEG